MAKVLNTNKKSGATKRLTLALAPALLIVGSLFLFLPFTLYKANIEEFALPLQVFLSNFILPAVVVLAALLAVSIITRGLLFRLWLGALTAIALLVWIQGNILPWNYGLQDGTFIEWTNFSKQASIDGIIWIGIILLFLVFSKRIQRLSAFACTTLIILQLLNLGLQNIQAREVWKVRYRIDNTQLRAPAEIFDFSKSKNVIHIILDGFASQVFDDIVMKDEDKYRKAFSGFTFFKETTSSFPTTYMSIPTIWSGKVYKNHMPLAEFYDSTMNGPTISSVLSEKGYEVDLVNSGPKFVRGKYTNSYIINQPYGTSKSQFEWANSMVLLDLTLFRAAPHWMKKLIYNDQSWFLQNMVPGQGKEATFRYFAHRAFIYDMIENATVTRDAPIYKYLHIMTPHAPYLLNNECRFTGKIPDWTKENVRTHLRCSLDHVIDLIDKFKELGIYDDALILINADHGHDQRIDMKNEANGPTAILNKIASTATPLLAVKPPGASGEMVASSAPVELIDIPDTLFSLLKIDESFGNRSAFSVSEDEKRIREYYYVKWRHDLWKSEYLPNLTGFEIDGSAFDGNSWSITRNYVPPGFSYKTDKIDFGFDEAYAFQRFGWGKIMIDPADEQKRFSFNRYSNVSLYLTLPKDKIVTLRLTAGLEPENKPVTMVMRVDGRPVGKKYVVQHPGQLKIYDFKLPAVAERPDVSIVTFEFSMHEGGGRVGNQTIAFESLVVK